MNRPILFACIFAGLFGLGLSGCRSADSPKETVKAAKPDDPSAWSEKTISKDDSDGGGTGGLSKSSHLSGGLSDEARSIESSLGVGH